MSDIPRPEHPDPQFQRDAWLNLNGSWTFAFDPGKSGRERGWAQSTGFDRRITVPFCPESSLSGVGHTDFIEAMWYHRTLRVPDDWAGRRVLLHFGAVDYEAEVFIDGRSVGLHYGGMTGFTCDITHAAAPGGEHHLVVRVHDDTRRGVQPGGKQSMRLHSHGCFYTRTTGIWQTVWLEAVEPSGLQRIAITPDLDAQRLVITPRLWQARRGLRLRVTAAGDATVTAPLAEGVPVTLPLTEPRPWSPDDPFLYDLTLEVLDGERIIDTVRSYAGLRKVHVEGGRVLLNNQPLFLRLVLDQGFYPEGVWTAPSDAALRRDIELSMAAGFNGARLHQKAFEPRFHYWADRLGYLTWGESASWGVSAWDRAAMRNFIPEWLALVERDRSHPSIIAWTPLNESWNNDTDEHRRTHQELYDATRALDPTRPINTASGGNFYRQDLITPHCYIQDPDKLRQELDGRLRYLRHEYGRHSAISPAALAEGAGGPVILDEFGGTRWNPDARRDEDRQSSWGYGDDPQTESQFLDRITGLTRCVVEHDGYAGYCYTQLTDVEQEQNGLYRYDRTPKFPAERLAAIFGLRPAWAAV